MKRKKLRVCFFLFLFLYLIILSPNYATLFKGTSEDVNFNSDLQRAKGYINGWEITHRPGEKNQNNVEGQSRLDKSREKIRKLTSRERVFRFQGKQGIPYFDPEGNFNLIYIDQSGHINLAFTSPNILQGISIQKINLLKDTHPIQVKKDRKGNVWLVWEKEGPNRKDIYIAQLKNKMAVKKRKVNRQKEGFNFSPQIEFSYQNEVWITWVNYYPKKQTIMVKNLNTGQTWEFYSSEYSALDPQIIIDGAGKVWLIWVAHPKLEDEILASYFNGVKWSPLLHLNESPQVPHLYPSISIDYNEYPYSVWSAYDGNDYELYSSRFDGSAWTHERKITNNQSIADTSPSISFLFHSIPVVVWKRNKNEKYELCLKYKIEEKWSHLIILTREDYLNSPRLVTFKEKIGLSWETDREVKSIILSFPALIELSFKSQGTKKIDLTQFMPFNSAKIPALDRDKYIGFGNSITYGIINLEGAPEKGYVPRLERLIDQNIKESQVVNQGVGGEKTAEGLSRISSVISTEQAKTIFLMEGTNDVKDESISMNTTAFNLKKMVKRCLNYNMNVFLASIIPKHPWRGMIKERILYLHSRTQDITSQLVIPFVDQFEAFYTYEESPHGWHALYSDATHPNERGYQLMAETWYDALVETPLFPPQNFRGEKKINRSLSMMEFLVVLNWEAPSEDYYVESYRIYLVEEEGTKLIKEVDASTLEYWHRNVEKTKEYKYAITAVTDEGKESLAAYTTVK